MDDSNPSTYNHATHFSYDIHGNVNTLIQDNPVLGTIDSTQRYKHIEYEYDLVSGNVNKVKYQQGQADQFYHKYAYDADNRLTQVWSSKSNPELIKGWDSEAKYFYYNQGPLARVELGDNQVQGVDYAYNLQGWIKAINSNVLKDSTDIGHDGMPGTVNQKFAKDAFGYSLNYYNGDYLPIGTLASLDSAIATLAGSDILKARHDLFNGNISSMVTTITKPTVYAATTGTPTVLPQATAYKYDQLNRLVEMQADTNLNRTTNTWASGNTYTGMYNNKFTYDANGSMLTALAKNQAGQVIDNQIYHHQMIAGRKYSNRTYAITDSATITSGEDLLDQTAYDNDADSVNIKNNYTYTEIGERKSNKQDSVSLITWTVYGKLKSVTHQTGCKKSDVEFNYDANNKRISKIVKPRDGSGLRPTNEWVTSYYMRDAQGNIMSVYTNKPNEGSFTQTEKHIYGSTEIGIDTKPVEMIGAMPDSIIDTLNRYLGYKHYSLSNHLGNVLAVITDKKIPRDINANDTVDYYEPEIIAANDYAPFGGLLAERTFNKDTFPNTFNGKRNDPELNIQDYGMRVYDPRTRELDWQVDLLFKDYPELSTYQFASNNPVANIDLDGLEKLWYMGAFAKNGTSTIIKVLDKTEIYSKAVKTYQDPTKNKGYNLIIIEGNTGRAGGETFSLPNDQVKGLLETDNPADIADGLGGKIAKELINDDFISALKETANSGNKLTLSIIKAGNVAAAEKDGFVKKDAAKTTAHEVVGHALEDALETTGDQHQKFFGSQDKSGNLINGGEDCKCGAGFSPAAGSENPSSTAGKVNKQIDKVIDSEKK